MAPTVILFLLAFVASTKADIDYSKVFPIPEPNAPHIPLPHGIPSPRITGGEEAVPNSLPYQVGLFIPVAGGNAFCGGSLLDTNTVLTAAHCVDGVIGAVTVVLGAHRIQDTTESTQVRVTSNNIIIHPEWNPSLIRNDLAIIKLPQAVTLNENIQTISLPENNLSDFEGEDATVSGWGRDSDNSQSISPVLRRVTIPVIANSVCNIAYLGVIQGTHICASGLGGRSSCNGDSGGPLVARGVQIGIVSFGIALGCEVGWPSAYARTSSYLAWINSHLS